MKKILVVSNNCLSMINSNGKTLYSFFKNYPQCNLAQMYIDNSLPDFDSMISYFRITDIENIKAILHPSSRCGNPISSGISENDLKNGIQNIETNSFLKLMRDLVWGVKKWKSKQFEKWIKEYSPDTVFFLAGDTGFMFDIVKYIVSVAHCELAVYITDDYILPRKNEFVLDKIRRKYIRGKMQSILNLSDYFFTISEEMRDAYAEIFNKPSKLVMNIPDKPDILKQPNNKQIELIYCGGLEYGREKTLIELAKAIHDYNKSTLENKAFLSVYSLDKLSLVETSMINIEGSSLFKGALNKEKLKKEIEWSDIAVHIESFNEKHIAKTKLSISTKISEYLANEKAILAIGPVNIASMSFLTNTAYCIHDIKDMKIKLEILFNNREFINQLSFKSKNKYEQLKKAMPSDIVVDELNKQQDVG